MQKQYNIKWREVDEKELARVVKNFNAKIYRERKKHPDKADLLPQTVKKSDIKAKIDTRQDFKREIASLSRFSKKDATKIVESATGNAVTKWELGEVRIQVATVNRKRSEERKKFNLDRPNMQMGTRKQNELAPKKFDFDKIRKGKEWELFKQGLDKELARSSNETAEKYKENYLKTIEICLGIAGQELHDFISNIPAETLYKNYWEDDEIVKIQFISDPLPAQDIAAVTLEHWQNIMESEE